MGSGEPGARGKGGRQGGGQGLVRGRARRGRGLRRGKVSRRVLSSRAALGRQLGVVLRADLRACAVLGSRPMRARLGGAAGGRSLVGRRGRRRRARVHRNARAERSQARPPLSPWKPCPRARRGLARDGAGAGGRALGAARWFVRDRRAAQGGKSGHAGVPGAWIVEWGGGGEKEHE